MRNTVLSLLLVCSATFAGCDFARLDGSPLEIGKQNGPTWGD